MHHARALAEELLAASCPQRWRHVQAVAEEARRLCDAMGLPDRVAVSASWLHDVGYSPAVADTGFHPLDGARFLRGRRWDERICRLVAHHSDAQHQATTEHLAATLCDEFAPLDGLDRDVLWVADATCGPNGQRFTLDERIAEVSRRYGRDHFVTARMMGSRDVLAAAIDRVAAACG